LKEVSNLSIPIFSIVDSDTIFFHLIDYAIIGNNKNFQSSFLYLNLLRNSIKKGYQKEILKILRII
jgi:ribosomal protein S2